MRALLVCLPLLAIHSTAAHAAPQHKSDELLYFHCKNGGGEYQATVKTELLLARAFFDPQRSDAENITLAAQHQLRYFWGITRSDPRWPPRMQVVVSRKEPSITIDSVTPGVYGRDLVIDWPRTEERLKIEPGYIARAVAAGRVRRTDPAIRAHVTIRFETAICAHGEQPGETLSTPLPFDPWLMHWLVPRKEFRPIRYHNLVDTTNPCADNDFADLPHPYYYWYDWYPTRVDRDDRKRPFDCTKLLRPGRDYAYYPIDLGPPRNASNDFGKLAATLRRASETRALGATAMLGVLDHEVTALALDAWRERIGQGHDTLADHAKDAQRAFDEGGAPRERGLGMLLLTLRELVKMIDDIDHTTTLDGEYLTVEVNGRYKQSGARLRLRLVLGMTDVFGPKPPAHWRYLQRGLASDDLVVYWGHSGIGENFRLAQIEKNLGQTPAQTQAALDGSPLQLVAFISCYSYMYFGQDLLAASQQRPSGTTFLFTGMGAVVDDRGPLPLFELVDRLLDKRQPTTIAKLPIGDEELWIVKRVD